MVVLFGDGRQALRNVVNHRDLLWQMVGNDLKGRYVGSFLGLFWNIIHPLIQILIYTVVFSQIMGARLGESSVSLCIQYLSVCRPAPLGGLCGNYQSEHGRILGERQSR